MMFARRCLYALYTIFLVSFVLLCSIHASLAFQPPHEIADTTYNPEIEKMAHHIYDEIRCLVCNGQSLDESQAVLAIAMRERIKKDLQNGLSQESILNNLQHQYGDKILMAPPVRADTYFLWLAPFIIFILACIVMFRMYRRD